MGKVWQTVVPIPPRTKKNSQQIYVNKKTNRPFVTMNPKQKEYEKDFLSRVKYEQDPIDYSVNVRMRFYMDSKRVVDLVNLQEMCLDCLVKAGVLADDNAGIVASMDGSAVLYDKEYPRTEIEVVEK